MTHYKTHVVYILLIHGIYYYVGCHCTRVLPYLTEKYILFESGNYLTEALKKKLITSQEYLDCVELVSVEEFNTAEEALNREAERIVEYKEKYKELCKNKTLGNKYSGLSNPYRSLEVRQRISKANKGQVPWNKDVRMSEEFKQGISKTMRELGLHCSEEHKRRISETHKGKHLSEEYRQRISEAQKGTHWYTDGIVNVRRSECPEGFRLGRA